MADFIGTANDDALLGTPDADLMQGLGGSDTIRGGAGADVIYGGEGNDSLFGELGDDQVYGGAGNDQIEDRDGGADVLVGEDGDDFIIVSRGGNSPGASVTMSGGAGNDRLWYQGYNAADVQINGGSGADTVDMWALNGTARISLGAESDAVHLQQLFANDIGHAQLVFSDFETESSGDRLDWN